MQGVVGSLITTSLQIYCRVFRSSGEKKLENRLRFYRFMAMSFV